MNLIDLIPSFGNLAFTLGAFVLALLVIVAVHEFGHYIVGRWTGIYAEVFSLGFGPVVWSRVDKRGTRWQIAALPLGGYVKFLGDSNAASGKDPDAIAALDDTQRRHSMHTAPLWARAATVAAGPVFNFLLSIIVFSALIGWNGIEKTPLTVAEIVEAPYTNELRPGDVIVAIEGIDPTAPIPEGETPEPFPIKELLEYTIIRDGTEMVVKAPYPYMPIVTSLTPGSPAVEAGLQLGDVILAVDGKPILAFPELREIVESSNGRPLNLTVWHSGETRQVVLEPRRIDLPLPDGGFETRWLIGITGDQIFRAETERLGPLEAIGYGADRTWFIIKSSLSGLYHMVTGAISSCNLRGPVGIAQTSGVVAAQGLTAFIGFIGVLSTAVGLLNMFPIPILDGGHLVFYAYEAIAGRPPSDKVMRILMSIGLALIATLMIFALSNDFLCP